MAVLDELLVSLGFKYEPKGVGKFRKDVKSTVDVVKKLAQHAAVAATAITGLVTATTHHSNEQGKAADKLGLTIERLTELQYAAQKSGEEVGSVESALTNLAEVVGQADSGLGPGVRSFGELGISIRNASGDLKEIDEIFIELSDRLQGMTEIEQMDYAGELNIDDLTKLLQIGPKGIAELTKRSNELGAVSKRDAEISTEFQESLQDVWVIIKHVSRAIARALVPLITQATGRFVEWWKINKDLFVQDVPRLIEKVSAALKLLCIITASWLAMRLVTALISLSTAFRGVALSALLADTAIAAIPALIAAAIAMIALLIEDYLTFKEGGQSFIGDMVKELPELAEGLKQTGQLIEFIGDVIGYALDRMSLLIEGLTSLIDLISDFSLDKINKSGIEKWTEQFLGLKDRKGNLTMLGKAFVSIDPFLDERGDYKNAFSGFDFGGIGDLFGDGSSINDKTVTTNQDRHTTKTSNMNIDSFEITVNGAGDPKLVAKEVYNSFQQATQDLNSAVDY